MMICEKDSNFLGIRTKNYDFFKQKNQNSSSCKKVVSGMNSSSQFYTTTTKAQQQNCQQQDQQKQNLTNKINRMLKTNTNDKLYQSTKKLNFLKRYETQMISSAAKKKRSNRALFCPTPDSTSEEKHNNNSNNERQHFRTRQSAKIALEKIAFHAKDEINTGLHSAKYYVTNFKDRLTDCFASGGGGSGVGPPLSPETIVSSIYTNGNFTYPANTTNYGGRGTT